MADAGEGGGGDGGGGSGGGEDKGADAEEAEQANPLWDWCWRWGEVEDWVDGDKESMTALQGCLIVEDDGDNIGRGKDAGVRG